jgi:creatinine amidohydrolase
MLWESLRAEEFEKAIQLSNGVCAIPIGCVEKHGQHLPLGTDIFQASRLTELAAEKEPVCIFPKLYFGEKQGAADILGTIIFSSKLIFDILTEACSEIARNGFKKIVLMNGHGGNKSMLQNFARSVLYDKNDYMVYVYSTSNAWPSPKNLLAKIETEGRLFFPELTDDDIKVLEDYVAQNKKGGHGCFTETSLILGMFPELVDLDKMNAESGASTHFMDHLTKEGIYTPFAWMANYPNSYAADIHEGLNERIAKASVKYSTEIIAKMFKVLKEETISDEYHNRWKNRIYTRNGSRRFSRR